jgi:hypothetical protein
MSTPTPKAFFANDGIDWRNTDSFSPSEKKALIDWYLETHGDGDLSLVRFAPFLMDNMPTAFKLSRRHLTAIAQTPGGGNLPGLVTVLSYLNTYATVGYAGGAFYEIIGARSQGASKQLVLDVLNHAYLTSGPMGMNAVAELSTDYLANWKTDKEKAIAWPNGWAADPGAFRSGIDLSTTTLTAKEIQAISDWHLRSFGEVPRHVTLFAKLNPEAFKIQRIRYEKAVGSAMPAQLAPLMSLHTACFRMQPAIIRRSLHHARKLGVARHHAIEGLLHSLRQSIDPMSMELVAEAVGDIFDRWDA